MNGSVIDFNCTRTFEHDIRMRTAEFSPDLRVLCEKIFASPHAGASRTRYPLWFANSIARLSPIAIVPQVSNSVNRLSTQSQSRMQTHQSKKFSAHARKSLNRVSDDQPIGKKVQGHTSCVPSSVVDKLTRVKKVFHTHTHTHTKKILHRTKSFHRVGTYLETHSDIKPRLKRMR